MKSLANLLTDFTRIRKGNEQLMNNLPREMGIIAVKVIKQNFALQGYDSGIGVTQWQPRAAATNKAYDSSRGKGQQGRYKGSVFSSTKPLLIQTKNLYNAVKYSVSLKRVFVGVDSTLIPYAKIQNEGGRGIPQRQYMPTYTQQANIKMLRAIEKKLVFERKKIFNGFEL